MTGEGKSDSKTASVKAVGAADYTDLLGDISGLLHCFMMPASTQDGSSIRSWLQLIGSLAGASLSLNKKENRGRDMAPCS